MSDNSDEHKETGKSVVGGLLKETCDFFPFDFDLKVSAYREHVPFTRTSWKSVSGCGALTCTGNRPPITISPF